MNFLYFNMSCRITIGNVVVTECNSVNIKNTIKELSDTATIVLPREFGKIQYKGRQATFEKQNILQFIKVDDPVKIELGYDDDLAEEFSGYVTKIGADIPLSIQCEDEMSKLKRLISLCILTI